MLDLEAEARSAMAEWKDVLWDEFPLQEPRIQIQVMDLKSRLDGASVDGVSCAIPKLQEDITDFQSLFMLLVRLHAVVKPRHHPQLERVVGRTLDFESKTLKVADLLEAKLHRFPDQIESILQRASKELDVEERLAGIKERFSVASLNLVSSDDDDNIVSVSPASISQVLAQLDVDVPDVQRLQFSAYKAPSDEEIDELATKLYLACEVIEQLNLVQDLWKRLNRFFEPSGKMRNALPEAAELFKQQDALWKRIMSEARRPIELAYLCQDQSFATAFRDIAQGLDKCEHAIPTKVLTVIMSKQESNFLVCLTSLDGEQLALPSPHFPEDALLSLVLAQAAELMSISETKLALIFTSGQEADEHMLQLSLLDIYQTYCAT